MTPGAFQIECFECEASAWGDPENDVEWWKEFHRDHFCPDANFEVTPL